MIQNVFLDTNIVLDFLDNQREEHEKVQQLIQYLILNNYKITLSEDILSTIFYIIKDKKATLQFFKTIIKKWNIVPYGLELIEEAIDIALKKDLDLEDLLQCLCAKENQCSVLITKDKAFFDCGISVMSTDGFLRNRDGEKR